MAETSFPVAGGAGVTDAAYERLMGPITGSGRYAFSPTSGQLSTPLVFADNTGRQVKAYANQSAIVRGFRWESGTTPVALALDANTSGNPRLDLIVLRLDRSTFTVRLGKTNGAPASVPAAPAAIQDSGSSGVYELPVATVRVVSSGTSGLPSILAADVTAVDWWLAPHAVVTRSGQFPPASHGMLMHQYDTGRMFRAVGSNWVAAGEVGAWTKVGVNSSWSNDIVYAQRINGFVHFQMYLTWNGSARAPNADTNVCTLPTTFRPAQNIVIPCWLTPTQIGLYEVIASSGIVVLRTFGSTFPTGGALVGTGHWPSV